MISDTTEYPPQQTTEVGRTITRVSPDLQRLQQLQASPQTSGSYTRNEQQVLDDSIFSSPLDNRNFPDKYSNLKEYSNSSPNSELPTAIPEAVVVSGQEQQSYPFTSNSNNEANGFIVDIEAPTNKVSSVENMEYALPEAVFTDTNEFCDFQRILDYFSFNGSQGTFNAIEQSDTKIDQEQYQTQKSSNLDDPSLFSPLSEIENGTISKKFQQVSNAEDETPNFTAKYSSQVSLTAKPFLDAAETPQRMAEASQSVASSHLNQLKVHEVQGFYSDNQQQESKIGDRSYPDSPSLTHSESGSQKSSVKSEADAAKILSVEDIVARMKEFTITRENKKQKKFENVFYFGLTTFVVGLLVYLTFAAIILTVEQPVMRILLIVIQMIFVAIAMIGMIILSTVDPSRSNFDAIVKEVNLRSRIIRYGTYVILTFVALSWYGCFYPATVILCIFAVLILFPEKITFKFSFKFISFMLIEGLFSFLAFAYNASEASRIDSTYSLRTFFRSDSINFPRGRPLWYCFALEALLGLIDFLILLLFAITNIHKWLRDKTKGRHPNTVMYVALYLYLNRNGMFNIIRGIASIYFLHYPPKDVTYFSDIDMTLSIAAICLGALSMSPPVLLAILGPTKVFEFTSRRFDRDVKNLEEDGRFIAELLDAVDISVGDEYWIIYDKCEKPIRNECSDHRKFWYRGTIQSINDESFVVALDESSPSDVKNNTLNKRGEGGLELVSVKRKIVKDTQNDKKDDMIELAKQQLRCIEWSQIKNLKDKLFASSARDGQPEKLNLNEWVARPLEENERISYFISHAWDDLGTLKYERLKEIAEEYHEKNNRYPTFWFDKVCFDQNNLSDSLKVLPINVMSCDQVLVLCGEKYHSRLWCIWELFTLFSFVHSDVAVTKLRIKPLNDDYDLLKELENFDVRNAHCFDPNEEAKIMKVIKAAGHGGVDAIDHFNGKIKKIAAAAFKNNPRRISSRSSSTRRSFSASLRKFSP